MNYFAKIASAISIKRTIFPAYSSQITTGFELAGIATHNDQLRPSIASGNLHSVRHLRYVPLAFLIGMEGFVFFLPFLILCMMIHVIMRNVSANSKL
jgi:hypothetical protein